MDRADCARVSGGICLAPVAPTGTSMRSGAVLRSSARTTALRPCPSNAAGRTRSWLYPVSQRPRPGSARATVVRAARRTCSSATRLQMTFA